MTQRRNNITLVSQLFGTLYLIYQINAYIRGGYFMGMLNPDSIGIIMWNQFFHIICPSFIFSILTNLKFQKKEEEENQEEEAKPEDAHNFTIDDLYVMQNKVHDLSQILEGQELGVAVLQITNTCNNMASNNTDKPEKDPELTPKVLKKEDDKESMDEMYDRGKRVHKWVYSN